MIYGYARCSTAEKENKQDINRQILELKNMGVSKDNIFFEYESGMKEERVQLRRLLDTVVAGDSICSTEVSRITRSTKQLCEIVEFAKRMKIKLVLGTFIVDCTSQLDSMTEGMLKMMGVFAELERNIISERVKSGVQNAKVKGKIIGRPRTTADNISEMFYRYYPRYKCGDINKSEFARLTGLSYPSIYKYLSIVEEKN